MNELQCEIIKFERLYRLFLYETLFIWSLFIWITKL